MPIQLNLDLLLTMILYIRDSATLRSLYRTSKRVKDAIDKRFPTVAERKIAFGELRFDRPYMTMLSPLGEIRCS